MLGRLHVIPPLFSKVEMEFGTAQDSARDLAEHFGVWLKRGVKKNLLCVFHTDVMLGCHVFYNAPRCYPICHCFCLSFLRFLAFPLAASLSKQHTIWLSCIYNNKDNNKNWTLCYVIFVKWY